MNQHNENNYKRTKAFLIARVSDPSQREALPAQEMRLKKYSSEKELNGEFFSFDETAYKDSRSQFQEIVDKITKYPDFCIVVFDKIDRFTRDGSSEVVRLLKGLVKKGKIELHFPSDNLYFHKGSPASDITRLGMGMVFGEYYSAAISDNVKRKFEQKVQDGEWPGKACVGYLNILELNDGKEVKNIIPDPERKDYVIKAFALRLKGNSFSTITKILKEDGFRSNTKRQGSLAHSQIEVMLRNPFYYGVMKYDGKLHPHKYEPIISKRTFDLVQNVNSDRSHDRTKTDIKKTFAFSGILKCAECGCTVSSYEQKGYVYLRCTQSSSTPCNQPHTSEAKIMPQITKILEDMSIAESLVDEAVNVLRSEQDNIQTFYKNAISQTRSKYTKLEKRLKVLYDDRLDGRITVTEYDKYVKNIKMEMEELERKLVEFTSNDKSFIVTSEHLLRLASQAKDIFESSQPAKKNKILRTLLANCTLSGKKLNFTLLKPFDKLCTEVKNTNWLRGRGSNSRPID